MFLTGMVPQMSVCTLFMRWRFPMFIRLCRAVLLMKVVLRCLLFAWNAMPVTEWSAGRVRLRNRRDRLRQLQTRLSPLWPTCLTVVRLLVVLT